MANILVYRDHILPKSEFQFMTRQYCGFEKLTPYWIGRKVTDEAHALFTIGYQFGYVHGQVYKMTGQFFGQKEIEKIKPIAIHAQFGRGGALALPLAEKLNIPLIVTFHGGDVYKETHYKTFPIPALFRLRMKRLISYARYFICVSPKVQMNLIKRGFPEEKTIVLPIGSDKIRLTARQKVGDTILFVGRFVEMKGLTVLVAAIKILRHEGFNMPFKFIGDGPEFNSIKESLEGIDHIDFLGWQNPDSIIRSMEDSALLCIPSIVARSGESEGLPSVAVEAMGHSVPVLASCEAGLESLIKHDVNGFIIPSNDPQALANKIKTALQSQDKLLAMGHEALKTIQENFNATVQSRQLENYLIEAKT